MSGIFGSIADNKVNKMKLYHLVKHSQQRGADLSGIIYFTEQKYKVKQADFNIGRLFDKIKTHSFNIILGYSSSINDFGAIQPVTREKISIINDSIIVNEKDIKENLTVNSNSLFQIDSEIIIAITEEYLAKNEKVDELPAEILSRCKGIISCVLVLPEHGKLILFSNNGSLFVGKHQEDIYFASEKYGLKLIGCKNIHQIKGDAEIIDIPISSVDFVVENEQDRMGNRIPIFSMNKNEENLLEYSIQNLKRCTKCLLPETMPYIRFDNNGECNYCKNYRPRNNPKPKEEFLNLIETYRRKGSEPDCIIPFSGGRDSCFGLHLVVNELKMKPITYSYDWGMVTDLGKRNISRMCQQLGVENILVAADISRKRKNIRMNLDAWLKSPHLGMMAMLTAGDKHFFRYIEDVKIQTEINLNLWGVNPLEVTHFKAGFLGIPPDFEETRVYSHGVMKQLRYHAKRFKAMLKSPGYFNRSLWDTLSGEYYRSFADKKDYYHIFDYWRWDEEEINNVLLNEYGWEKATDTNTTWRIGDGTAAFYNYVYYTVAGFTEHDTFRSNQIREGQITRERALELISDENRPRYQNIKWYLDILGFNFEQVIKIINRIPRLYEH